MRIVLDGIVKTFGSYAALRGVGLSVEKGEFLALLGPSGSGKTTLLRILAGLEFPDAGRLQFDGVDIADHSVRERHVGFVFQHYALFRHMTVAENIAFGLRVKPRAERMARAQIDARVQELLQLVQLERLGNRYPSQLSGGQRQRVALARALAIEPKMLLLDEPFGALDAKVRKDLRRWLRRLHDDMGLTSIFVTHDQEEALELADRVAVMNDGLIEQIGTPDDVYHEPATAFVYEFLGNANRLPCRIKRGEALIGTLSVPASEFADIKDAAGIAFARPHDINLQPLGAHGLPVRINHIFSAGANARLELERIDGGGTLEVEMSHETLYQRQLRLGQEVTATFNGVRVFRKAT